VYVLDEPTTGLHFEDIRKLLLVLRRLVDKGNTVIVIEHNLDVIKTADWVIDMGPEGGHKGGLLVAIGTPEELAETPESYTGEWLRHILGLKGNGHVDRSSDRRQRSAPPRPTVPPSPFPPSR
jgi:excinuclease ABC subunit A